mmetsp:Transcript_74/g.232  ORF Transcript_74/g.232 Transcript_74/m.232 type:complete len:372 (+) Transcript_74:294-1409(+)
MSFLTSLARRRAQKHDKGSKARSPQVESSFAQKMAGLFLMLAPLLLSGFLIVLLQHPGAMQSDRPMPQDMTEWDLRQNTIPVDETGLRDPKTLIREFLVLLVEAMESPTVVAYHRMLANSLSRAMRPAVAAIVSHAESLLSVRGTAWARFGKDPMWGAAGETLIAMDVSMRSAVLKGVWERLSGMAEESLAERGKEMNVGHITVGEALRLQNIASGIGVRVVCEVGFNAGHSAAAVLLAGRELVTIDINSDAYVKKAAALLRAMFPGKLEFMLMDSKEALGVLKKRGVGCDLIRIDGSHIGGMAAADLAAAQLINSGPRLVWMDDVGCSNWNCLEPSKAWQDAVGRGLVVEEDCSVGPDTSHGYCIGRFVP